ncbi:MAG: hypothetical protein KM310_06910 [Clostridiales bacterium]|nr:hypothetical protein [Clostridiales bacterium]
MFLSLDLKRYRGDLWRGVRPFDGADVFSRWALGRLLPVSTIHPEEEISLWLGLMVVRGGRVAVLDYGRRHVGLLGMESFEMAEGVPPAERRLGEALRWLGRRVRDEWRLRPFEGVPRFLAWIHDPWTPENRDRLALVAVWEVPGDAEAEGAPLRWWSQEELDGVRPDAWVGFSRWVPGLLRLNESARQV